MASQTTTTPTEAGDICPQCEIIRLPGALCPFHAAAPRMLEALRLHAEIFAGLADPKHCMHDAVTVYDRAAWTHWRDKTHAILRDVEGGGGRIGKMYEHCCTDCGRSVPDTELVAVIYAPASSGWLCEPCANHPRYHRHVDQWTGAKGVLVAPHYGDEPCCRTHRGHGMWQAPVE